MDAISLGPFMLATDRLYLIIAVILFFLFAEGLEKRYPEKKLSSWAQRTFWYSLVAARLVYVALNQSSFNSDWLSTFYFWQPGYSIPAALITATTVTLMHFKHHKRLLIAASSALGLSVIIWFGLQYWQPFNNQQSVQTLPAIHLPKLDGDALDLRQQTQPMIINLWASWCGPCRREMPSLVQFAQQQSLKEKGIDIRLVNVGESNITVEHFLKQMEPNIPDNLILLDPNQSLMQHFNAPGLPVTLAFNNGLLVDSHIGELNQARLHEMAKKIGSN